MKAFKKYLPYFLLACAITFYVIFFTRLSILKYLSFFSCAADDLAIHNNALWHTASGRFFYQSIGERFLDFHPSFFYLFIAPVYRLFPHIFTLFVLGHLALSLSVLPVYGLAKRIFNSDKAAFLFALSFLLSNQVHHFSFVDHNVLISFSILFLLSAFYFFTESNIVYFVIFALLSMMCRDETAFIFAMFSIYAFTMRMRLRWKLIPLALSISYFLIVWGYIMPILGYNGANNPYVWNFLGENSRRTSFLKLFFSKGAEHMNKLAASSNFAFFRQLLGDPLLLFSILTPEVILIASPIVIAAQLSSHAAFLSLESIHHVAYLIIFIFLASMVGVKRFALFFYKRKKFPPSLTEKSLFMITGLLFMLISFYGCLNGTIMASAGGLKRGHNAIEKRFILAKNLYDKVFYTLDDSDNEAWEFIALIPRNVSVSTTQAYLPALSSRGEIYHFGCTQKINERDGHDLEADYIYINKKDDYNGFGSREVSHQTTLGKLNEVLKSSKYVIVKESERFILLKKVLLPG